MANTGKSNPGNFANDKEKASEAGKKGGQASGSGNAGSDMKRESGAGPSSTGKKGGSGGKS